MENERSRTHKSSVPLQPRLRLLSPVRLNATWSKALWKRHPGYEDNYVPADFLASTRVKFEERKTLPSLRALMIRQAVPQTTFTSFISLVIAVFRSLLDGSVGPSDLVLLCAGACIALRLGFKLHIWFQKAQTPSTKQRARIAARLGASGNYLLPPFLLYLSSPLLLSLTKATTSDSIWPLAGGLFVLSSILGGFGSDYQDDPKVEEQDPGISALSPVAPTRTAIMPPTIRQEIERTGTSAVPMESAGEDPKKEKAKILQSCLSVTSCLSACIVLASRLESSWEVFSLLSFVALAMGSLIWLSRPVIPLRIKICVALSVQAIAILTCSLRSSTMEEMATSPEGALILLNLAFRILGPILIRQAWRWHVS